MTARGRFPLPAEVTTEADGWAVKLLDGTLKQVGEIELVDGDQVF